MKLIDWLLRAQFVLAIIASPVNETWDYIVVGGGASGIPLADRLSESGKSVLLIERGWASSGRWGGTRCPAWLDGTNLTRFDVPALYQYIWSDHPENEDILCTDYGMTASCVLGGGTAVNAGQFYRPTKGDFDLNNMPPGFQSSDMMPAIEKAFSRLPWTEFPSQDHKSYLTNGTYIVTSALTNTSRPNPYQRVHANDDPDAKNHTISLGEFCFLNGERGGPMATYLVSASQRKNFKLQMNTTVKRVTRTGDDISGVEVAASGSGGVSGIIRVTPQTGRVILSAGVFGTSKILFRSGIGPKNQLLAVQKSTDGPTMIEEKYWIDLPVGEDLDDTPSLYLAVGKSDIGTYDWEGIYNHPNSEDVKMYLEQRSGPLAMIQPSLGPSFWDQVVGGDGRSRTIMWTVTSGSGPPYRALLLFAANLNLGKTSRGRLAIDSNLFVNVTKLPYFNDVGDHDFQALLTSASAVLDVIQTIPNSSLVFPPVNVTLEAYFRDSIATQPVLTANHWVGSAHMSASCSDARAVVDSTTKVCGTRNLHIVDAGIVNGVPASNPQGVLISVAERAAEAIKDLEEWS